MASKATKGRSAASVYMAAVLEYLTAEVLEVAVNAAREHRETSIASRHVQMFVSSDENYEERSKLLTNVTISECGVLPNFPQELLPKKSDGDQPQQNGHKGTDAGDGSRTY
ncbi:hypothetical protein HPB49_004694 [Dermacentor silvarum]|uniref:Uncharacterized protein n=1 Tax=Dermacentor silvarum TaxID=543639 RepID=A0ACB8DUP8_DERSI|nr:hypothetical protein HPB49_004694 [Dermacentor silvarum]